MKIHHCRIVDIARHAYDAAMELTLRIREIRERRGYTIGEVADMVGVSTGHLSEVERGLKNLNNHLLVRIATALEVYPVDLIDHRDGDARFLAEEAETLDADQLHQVLSYARFLRTQQAAEAETAASGAAPLSN